MACERDEDMFSLCDAITLFLTPDLNSAINSSGPATG
jgi:hypothetical protein